MSRPHRRAVALDLFGPFAPAALLRLGDAVMRRLAPHFEGWPPSAARRPSGVPWVAADGTAPNRARHEGRDAADCAATAAMRSAPRDDGAPTDDLAELGGRFLLRLGLGWA